MKGSLLFVIKNNDYMNECNYINEDDIIGINFYKISNSFLQYITFYIYNYRIVYKFYVFII